MHKCFEGLWPTEIIPDHRVEGLDGVATLSNQPLGCRSRDLHHQRERTGTRGDGHLIHHEIIPSRRTISTLWISPRR